MKKQGYYLADVFHTIISFHDSSTKKTIYANPLLLYFLQIMILKNTKAIQFLKTFFPENEYIQIHRNIFFIPSAGVGFFSRPPPQKTLSKQNPDTIWITSNRRFFKSNLSSSLTFYLFKKENMQYKLYDRRYLKSKTGPYLLPPT
ncbi:MAG: hypothetical protein JSS09_08500, partial [Verrucomicrobia bacterium]|nr:hypothetical protein [Verrucomicrobiota bacterium]